MAAMVLVGAVVLLGTTRERPLTHARLERLSPSTPSPPSLRGLAGRGPHVSRQGPVIDSTRRLARILRPRRSRTDSAADMAALVDRVARRCSSGESLGRALEASIRQPASAQEGSAAGPFNPLADALARGDSVREAIAHVRMDDADIVLTTHAIALCAADGGNIVETLDRAAATLRERHGIRLERYAQAAQARLSAQILTAVPLGFACWTLITTTSVRHFVSTPAGAVVIAAGLGMNLLGWRLMERAIRGVT